MRIQREKYSGEAKQRLQLPPVGRIENLHDKAGSGSLVKQGWSCVLRSLLCLIIICILCPGSGLLTVRAGKQFSEDSCRILFVGNSFTRFHELNRILGDLAESLGLSVQSHRLSSNWYSLNRFVSDEDLFGQMLLERMEKMQDYDIFVLQEQSMQPILDYDDFLGSVRTLCDRIDETQDHAEVYLFETWGYEKGAKELEGSVSQMQDQLLSAYQNAAEELGVHVIPVGEAFRYVTDNYEQITLLTIDNKHPSYAGSYLAACVITASILDVDVRESDFTGWLNEESAAILQEAAMHVLPVTVEMERK